MALKDIIDYVKNLSDVSPSQAIAALLGAGQERGSQPVPQSDNGTPIFSMRGDMVAAPSLDIQHDDTGSFSTYKSAPIVVHDSQGNIVPKIEDPTQFEINQVRDRIANREGYPQNNAAILQQLLAVQKGQQMGDYLDQKAQGKPGPTDPHYATLLTQYGDPETARQVLKEQREPLDTQSMQKLAAIQVMKEKAANLLPAIQTLERSLTPNQKLENWTDLVAQGLVPTSVVNTIHSELPAFVASLNQTGRTARFPQQEFDALNQSLDNPAILAQGLGSKRLSSYADEVTNAQRDLLQYYANSGAKYSQAAQALLKQYQNVLAPFSGGQPTQQRTLPQAMQLPADQNNPFAQYGVKGNVQKIERIG